MKFFYIFLSNFAVFSIIAAPTTTTLTAAIIIIVVLFLIRFAKPKLVRIISNGINIVWSVSRIKTSIVVIFEEFVSDRATALTNIITKTV